MIIYSQLSSVQCNQKNGVVIATLSSGKNFQQEHWELPCNHSDQQSCFASLSFFFYEGAGRIIYQDTSGKDCEQAIMPDSTVCIAKNVPFKIEKTSDQPLKAYVTKSRYSVQPKDRFVFQKISDAMSIIPACGGQLYFGASIADGGQALWIVDKALPPTINWLRRTTIEECYVVLRGYGKIHWAAPGSGEIKTFDLVPGTSVTLPPDVATNVEHIGDTPLSIICACVPAHPGEQEMREMKPEEVEKYIAKSVEIKNCRYQ